MMETPKPMNLLKIIIFLTSLTVSASGYPQSIGERLQTLTGAVNSPAEPEFLHPDQAFILSATVTGPESVNVQWRIARDYYLYHDKFSFEVTEGDAVVTTDAIIVPPGKVKEDPSFGSVEVNIGDIDIDVPLTRGSTAEIPIALRIGYQGCKEDSLCYPPIKKTVPLILSALSTPVLAAGTDVGQVSVVSESKPVKISEQDSITQRLIDGGLLANVLLFLGAGLLLSLTPCVFPMIPILSGIILGQKETITPARGFMLSLVYVLAMALTYAVAGVFAAMVNFNIQAAAQNIWIISIFSLVFIALAMSMFGFYEIQMPAGLQTRLASISNSQQGGTLSGVAIMGMVSAIIVGPCVAPPLVGALAYISQTGNELLGGLALFAMGMGMGVPLLIIGGSAGTLLPRAGPWMDTIKKIFGVGLLGLAIWFMSRVIPVAVELYLWAALLIITAIYMGALDQLEKTASWARLWKGTGLIMLIYGILLVIGASSGSGNIYRPLEGIAGITGNNTSVSHLQFKTIKSVSDLEAELKLASQAGKPVMLDFYADWCIECIRMESNTFPKPEVQAALEGVVLLQADVTRHDEVDQALLAHFQIYGPPAILFFGEDAQERKPYRLFGFFEAEKFVTHVREALSS